MLVYIPGLVAGCVTVSGNYRVSAVGAGGEKLADNIFAQGRGIYAVRNAICSQYPRATVLISDAQTGSHCRAKARINAVEVSGCFSE